MTKDTSHKATTNRLDTLTTHGQRAVAARSLYIRRARLTPFAAARVVEVR